MNRMRWRRCANCAARSRSSSSRSAGRTWISPCAGISILSFAHVLVGEPPSTSPEHALLEHPTILVTRTLRRGEASGGMQIECDLIRDLVGRVRKVEVIAGEHAQPKSAFSEGAPAMQGV